MFDTTMIGKRIKQARIDKNMTQLAMADAMGVSYQAVSNWERGNSMPDISKLGDLCAALDITVNALLGLEETVPNAVKKAMDNEELTMEELTEVAPVLLPQTLHKQLDEKQLEAAKTKLEEKMVELNGKVARMKEEMAEKMAAYERDGVRVEESTEDGRRVVRVSVRRVNNQETHSAKRMDLSRIAELAPFLDQGYLDELIRSADLPDLDGIGEIVPFLSRETLDYIVEQAGVDDLEMLREIAPFLSRETIDKLVSQCTGAEHFSTLEMLAPFVSRETLDALAETVMPDSIWEVVSIAPFFSNVALDKLVCRCEDEEKMDAIRELAPFLSNATLNALAERCIEKGKTEDLEDIYPFLPKDTLRKLAKRMMEQKDPEQQDEMDSCT